VKRDGTHDKTGCINEQENSALSIGIEGEASRCVSQADLPGIICDRHGNEKQQITLRKMRHNSKANINLLSLTKLLMDGWTMTGDANAIMMGKGVQKSVLTLLSRQKEEQHLLLISSTGTCQSCRAT